MTTPFKSALPSNGNVILQSLTRDSRDSLQGLREVELESQLILAAEGEGIDGLYFPLSCLICRLVSLPDGTTVKVSLAGREGMVGSSALVDGVWSSFRGLVQLPGKAMFLPRREAVRLRDARTSGDVLFRYVLLLVRESSLTAACNRAHTATQRLARWLLLIQDRAERDAFPMTHESLATMLGVRRERISLSAEELREDGAIDYRRGRIAIINREALESRACTCYSEITSSYLRFLETLR